MSRVKRLPYKTFKYIYRKVPRLCVDVIVKTPRGIILTKRSIPPAKGWWHIPGGTILWGETVEQAVKRVAREEVGVEVKIKKF
ncbi:NUDIX domain-containing protein, partial [Patescibacteria group bacterium]|nr:NUDIX domain-containing protein [Patescibacteria group bacterium]